MIQQGAVLDFSRAAVHYGRIKRRTAYWRLPTKMEDYIEPQLHHSFPVDQIREFEELVKDFRGLFAEQGPPTTSGQHVIRLKDQRPIRAPSYKHSAAKLRIIEEEVEKMLHQGIIEHSTSAYNSPVVIVKKKDGSARFCIDYRRLNEVTHDEVAVLPTIQDTLRDLGTAKVFSVLDLKTGYWQIPMQERSRVYTAFSTPDGSHYQFKVMPFGLKNAPSTFQQMMAQEVLSGFIRKFVFVYLDDIIIFSPTYEEHLRHLRLVMERLRQYGLRCSEKKCRFGSERLDYLGHQVTATGNEPQEVHLQRIFASKPPSNRRQLKAFLGLCGWVREYIPRFAELAGPLTRLLSKGNRWTWGLDQETAWSNVQAAFREPLQLHRPDPQLPYTLQTDASGHGMAAVLLQHTPEGDRRIISYASSKLTSAQARYHSNEQECLAVVWAVEKYRPYLEDRRFHLKTDNRALTWLKSMVNSNAKLTRWAMLLQQYTFDVSHCPGIQNQLADALSRSPVNKTADLKDDAPLGPPTEPNEASTSSTYQTPTLNAAETLYERLLRCQQEDAGAQRLAERWERLQEQDPVDAAAVALRDQYVLKDGVIFKREPHGLVLLVPPSGALHLLRAFHDNRTAGHPGAEETYAAINRRYYLPKLATRVREYVSKCNTCVRHKPGPARAPAPLTDRPSVSGPFDSISVDIMGPYPVTQINNNRYILVATDIYSRWVEAKAVSSTTVNAITKFIHDEVICRYGYPRLVLSDNGPQFRSANWKRTIHLWGAEHWTTPLYHPRANPVERRNQEIKKQLRILLDRRAKDSWDQELPAALYHLRSRKNASTGQSPAAMVLGRELPRPGEWALPAGTLDENPEDAQRLLADVQRHQARYRERYLHRRPPVHRYQPGDQVFIKRDFPEAFGTKYEPGVIKYNLGRNVYRVEFSDGRYKKLHVDRIRPTPRPQPVPNNEEEDLDNEEALVPLAFLGVVKSPRAYDANKHYSHVTTTCMTTPRNQ